MTGKCQADVPPLAGLAHLLPAYRLPWHCSNVCTPFVVGILRAQVLVLLDTKRSGYVDLALLIMCLLALW